MPTLTLHNRAVEFFYTDSGRPDTAEYKTLVALHGTGFHSASFKRIQNVIGSRPLRLICVNRRGYPDSTPYSPDDVKALAGETSESDRAAMLARHGMDLAFFIDGLIQKYGFLDKEGCGVGVLGWSIGNIFLLALLASITSLPTDMKERLGSYVKTVILLEPPSRALAIPDPPKAYNPLHDDDIPSENRGPMFVQFISSYYIHGDLSTRDLDQLNYRTADPSRKPTIANMTTEEMNSITDFAAVELGEVRVFDPLFTKTLANQKIKALFDPEVRSAWREAKVWLPWGPANTWTIILAVWGLEKEDDDFQKAHDTQPYINFKFVNGGNHFLIWDYPEKAMDVIGDCMGFKDSVSK